MNSVPAARITPLPESADDAGFGCDLVAELLRAIAIAWHDLGSDNPIGRSIAAVTTHQYLGEVMAWAVRYEEWWRASLDADFVEVAREMRALRHDPMDWYMARELPQILRLLGWPLPSDEQVDAVEGGGRTLGDLKRAADAKALRALLQGE